MKGTAEMLKFIKDAAAKFPDRVAAAIYHEGQIEMTESKKRCPVSPVPAPKGVVPGALRASGMVHEPVRSGNNISVTLSYGGAAIQYAIVQHEELDYIHTTGQAKYLESVLNESQPYMAARVAARVHFDKGER
mgnify:CR=1 FL=1